MNKRADPFGEDAPVQKLDLSGFTPGKRPEKVNPAEIRKVATQASFQSREPAVQPSMPETTEPRLYRTGRDVQFSCKVTQSIKDEIYALTDELGRRTDARVPGMRWTVGMTVERMVAALRRDLAEESGQKL